jgi:MFS family permease
MGLGTGLYWPATEATVADLTTPEQRNEAYSITRLADTVGLGIGVVLGGLLISTTGAYRGLFIVDGISFLIFFGVIYLMIKETNRSINSHSQWDGWKIALSDRRLLTYFIVNTMFTTYIVQIDSTLPLYLTNFVKINADKGFEPSTISILYTGYLTLSVLIQLPIVRRLNQVSRAKVLMMSAGFWAIAFTLIWLTGTFHYAWAVAVFAALAFAVVTYLPSASALVVDLAPDSLRGVYLGINSQCWALGYFIGPPLGGWALDQSRSIASGYWLFLVGSVAIAVMILQVLDKMISQTVPRRL